MRPSRLLYAALLIAGSVALAGAWKHLAATRPDVVVIVIDTLRADHIGCYGYRRPTSPVIDSLAARGVRFDVARSTCSWTLPGVASILTGLYPAVHGAELANSVLSPKLPTLARDFRNAGYQTAAFSANAGYVTPQQGLAPDFDHFEVLEAPLVSTVREADAEQVVDAALKWFGGSRTSKPRFVYLHLFDPHAGYRPAPALARKFGVDPNSRMAGVKQWSVLLTGKPPPANQLAAMVALYDAEIAAADAGIGRFLEAMEIGPDDIVVITSDHGEEFGEHGGLQHSRTLYEEMLRVPLIVVAPGLPRGKVVETPVSIAGLRATITELAGIPVTGSARIEPSLLETIRGEHTATPVYADLAKRKPDDPKRHRRAMIDGRWKLIVDPDGANRLHDLAADPSEQKPATEETRRKRMVANVDERDVAAAQLRELAPSLSTELSEEKRKQLEALGYLQ